jgi:hypothetical protein
VDEHTDPDDDDFARRLASRVGSGVERSLEGILDELEDISLWLMERAAGGGIPDERIATAADTVRKLHHRSRPVPRQLGRIVAAATLAGARIGAELRRALDEVAEDGTFRAEDSAPSGRWYEMVDVSDLGEPAEIAGGDAPEKPVADAPAEAAPDEHPPDEAPPDEAS